MGISLGSNYDRRQKKNKSIGSDSERITQLGIKKEIEPADLCDEKGFLMLGKE